MAHGADRRRNRHVIVVEDHDQARLVGPGIVHGLVRHASGHRAVTDDTDDVILPALKVSRLCESQTGRNRSRRMRRAEGVEVALGPLGKAGEPAGLAQRAHLVAAARQDLVGIALVTDVPDELVVRRVEDGVNCNRQFHNAQSRAEVAAGDGDDVDNLFPHLIRDLFDFRTRTPLQVRGGVDGIQLPVRASFCHHTRSFRVVSSAVLTRPVQHIIDGMQQDSGIVTENRQMFLGLSCQ